MRKLLVGGFILLIAASVIAVAAARRRGWEGDRVAGWRGDIAQLVAEARRVHAGPTRPAHGPEFAVAAAELERRVPDLPDHRIAVELQRLLALLGDGHSLVYATPSPRVSFGMLPIDLYLFEDGLFIVDGQGPASPLVGSRITRFGDLTAAETLRRMEPYVSRDNAMAFRGFAALYLILPAFLEAWGATDDKDGATLTVDQGEAGERTVTLAAGPARRFRKRLFAPPGAPGPVPLYLQPPERNCVLQALPEHRAVYFQFNQVADAPDLTLSAFASRLADALQDRGVENLIVDLRHNNGGNNQLLAPLLEAIREFAASSPERRVYVLTSRTTFSAAQNFINRLERQVPGAIFAGEPSMSSPNFTGEDNPVTLAFSGLTVSLSNRYWQDSDPGDPRPWIEPQIKVGLTSRDWLRNEYPVLAAVFRAIATRD
ncbi:MAG: hypothetical protein EHM91_12970 [Planctomycetota bacterium]|nr:MAG: hypothetical protein EHM91_12970 [Planctomycetota bacterium]